MGSLVLCYHSINYTSKTTPDDLEKDIQTLIERGFKPIKLSDIYNYISNNESPPDKTVHITFDDGYADSYLHAYPILRKYGFYGTVFVIVNKITKGIKRATYDELTSMNIANQIKELIAKSEFVSWEELKTMIDSGLFEVGSHSLNHRACFCCNKIHKFNEDNSYKWFLELTNDRRLGTPIYKKRWDCATICMRDDLSIRDHMAEFVKKNGGALFLKKPNAQSILMKEYKHYIKKHKPQISFESQENKLDRLTRELYLSKKIIEENLNIDVHHFCYPWGDYDAEIIYELQKQGYKTAFTLHVGIINKKTYPYLMPRVEVRNSKWLKKRLVIYSSSTLSNIYSKVHKKI